MYGLRCILIVASVLFLDGGAVAQAQVKIDPVGNVCTRHWITGSATGAEAPIIVIHPVDIAECWVQRPVALDNGRWQLRAQFGENGLHYGRQYEVRAFVTPSRQLSPGKTKCWPQAKHQSNLVTVTKGSCDDGPPLAK
jgi:hypothetical protein